MITTPGIGVPVNSLTELAYDRLKVKSSKKVRRPLMSCVVKYSLSLWVLTHLGYLSERLSTSRFNRRLHAVADWLRLTVETLGELFAQGVVFIIDSMPLPVCRRARRNQKVRGRDYCGYCAAKKDKFFGFRLHLVCTPAGLPVSFAIVAWGYHDLTPLHELTFGLPAGACVFGDKGYNSAPDERTIFDETGVRVIPIRRKNMARHEWADEFDLKRYRKGIETVNSQLEKMGTQRLHTRTNAGFEVKCMLLCSRWHVQTSTSNQGKLYITITKSQVDDSGVSHTEDNFRLTAEKKLST